MLILKGSYKNFDIYSYKGNYVLFIIDEPVWFDSFTEALNFIQYRVV